MSLVKWRNRTARWADQTTRIPLVGYHIACRLHDIHIRICQAEIRRKKGGR